MSQRCASGDKISFVGVVTDAVNFTVVFDLMLDHYLVCHTLVILSDCFRGTQRTVSELSLQDCLIGKVNFGHYETILLLARCVRPIEDVTKSILVVVISGTFILIDPPLDAKRRPLELLRVESLIEIGCVSAPNELFCDVAV